MLSGGSESLETVINRIYDGSEALESTRNRLYDGLENSTNNNPIGE
jgi:hypothetical protein